MKNLFEQIREQFIGLGKALAFFVDVARLMLRGRIRWNEVLKQVYQQGLQSMFIVALTGMASGIVLAMQGCVMLVRFGAKEFVAQLVILSLLREMGPVFTCLVFSGKAGARMAAELGTMNVNDQITATRTMGVDPLEFLVVPRVLACCFVIPILTVFAEMIGFCGGYSVGVFDAGIPSSFYISQTLKSVKFVDFFSGFFKTMFFSVLIGWICCYKGFYTKGGSIGVGKYTTQAVALSYIAIILSNTLLTKIILTFWG